MSQQIFRSLSALVLTLAASLSLSAQAPTTQVHDSSALHPPAGARVAIVEFADLECPKCAVDNPTLKAAAAQYHIPWVRHDFPLTIHHWSRQAAAYARWFDASPKGKALGNEYRDAVFANQSSIYNLGVLLNFTGSFAKRNGLQLPFSLDPKFEAEVQADYALGQRIGINHTPTVWIVTDHSKGAPFIEVTETSRLYQIIDKAMADTRK